MSKYAKVSDVKRILKELIVADDKKALNDLEYGNNQAVYHALNSIEELQTIKPLTYEEKCIFLAAMGREKELCKKVGEENLMSICRNIETKVKNVLWD